MKIKHIALGALAVSALGAAAIYQGAFAYKGDPSVHGPNYTPERHEQMLKAFENNDYQAWKDLHGDRGRVSQVVNQQNFNKFTEMRRLMLEGKTDQANQIRQELGLGQKNGTGMGRGQGNGMHRNFVDNNNDGVCDNCNR